MGVGGAAPFEDCRELMAAEVMTCARFDFVFVNLMELLGGLLGGLLGWLLVWLLGWLDG